MELNPNYIPESISKKQLAAHYKISTKTLNSWINQHLRELEEAGYKKQKSIMTPKVVGKIIELFGHPITLQNKSSIK